jgi:hypothetical protein
VNLNSRSFLSVLPHGGIAFLKNFFISIENVVDVALRWTWKVIILYHISWENEMTNVFPIASPYLLMVLCCFIDPMFV